MLTKRFGNPRDPDEAGKTPSRAAGLAPSRHDSTESCKATGQMGSRAARLRACSHTSVLVHGLRPDAQEESRLALNWPIRSWTCEIRIVSVPQSAIPLLFLSALQYLAAAFVDAKMDLSRSNTAPYCK